MPIFIDLTDQEFGRLTVTEKAGKNKHGRILWRCECSCGAVCVVDAASLRSGHTASCGCLHRELLVSAKLTHGESKRKNKASVEYEAWCGMIKRCTNPSDKLYHHYGGRGIRVCDVWLNSFEDFLKDVGRKPSSQHSIDRYPDNNGDYEPGNVRWATQKEQMRNTRANHLVTINGETRCINEWVELSGISRSALRGRIKRGWPSSRLLEPPH